MAKGGTGAVVAGVLTLVVAVRLLGGSGDPPDPPGSLLPGSTATSAVRPARAPAAATRPTARAPTVRAAPSRTPAGRTELAPPCDPSYPGVCIPPPSQVGDLDCRDVGPRRFAVLPPDPHGFDADADGTGCER